MKRPLLLLPSSNPPDLAAGMRLLYLDNRGRAHYARIVADLDGLYHAQDALGPLALTRGEVLQALPTIQ